MRDEAMGSAAELLAPRMLVSPSSRVQELERFSHYVGTLPPPNLFLLPFYYDGLMVASSSVDWLCYLNFKWLSFDLSSVLYIVCFSVSVHAPMHAARM